MDLNQVDAWTRDALEAEARRIGIKGCEYRTRTELVRLILRDRYGETWNAGRETLARGVRGLSEVRAALGAAIERTIVSVLSLPDPRGAAWGAPRTAEATNARATDDLQTAVPDVRAGETLRAPPRTGAKRARKPVVTADPIATGRATVPDAPEAPKVAADSTASANDEDRVAWRAGARSEPIVHWHASVAGIRRARAVLGADGELAVRVVVVAPDEREFVRTEVVDHGPVDATGEVPAIAAVAGARRIAAVGLRAGERFVAIAHARA